MKKLLIVLALAGALKADIVGPMPVQQLDSGAVWGLSGSVTYALNNALTGTSSAAVDLSGSNGVLLSLTGTSLVTIYFSNQNLTYTTGAVSAYQVQAPGNYRVGAKARYISFVNSGKTPTGRVSAFYYLETPSVAVTAPTPTPGIQGVTITASPKITVAQNISVHLSLTPVCYNLSSTAGASGKGYIYHFQPNWGGASAQLEVAPNPTPSAAFLGGLGPYIPTSMTAGVKDGPFVSGSCLLLKAGTATDVDGYLSVQTVP